MIESHYLVRDTVVIYNGNGVAIFHEEGFEFEGSIEFLHQFGRMVKDFIFLDKVTGEKIEPTSLSIEIGRSLVVYPFENIEHPISVKALDGCYPMIRFGNYEIGNQK